MFPGPGALASFLTVTHGFLTGEGVDDREKCPDDSKFLEQEEGYLGIPDIPHKGEKFNRQQHLGRDVRQE